MEAINQDLIGETRHAHLIGVGGVGMSALARVLKYRGLEVSGSDVKENQTIRNLRSEGIPVTIGHRGNGFGSADLIIYSSAIGNNNPELSTARSSSRKVHHRAEILASLLNQAETSVAVAGTHGKTTTSSMVSFVLSELGRKPTCLVGGDVLNLGTNTVLGNPNLWVSEVDESDQTHELYTPNYAVLTNLEEDHMDHYKSRGVLEASFEKFLGHLHDPGLVVYLREDPTLHRLVSESGKPKVSFGFSGSADFSAQGIELRGFETEFDLCEAGFFVSRIRLSVPGTHNVANALAAIAILIQLGLDLDGIRDALAKFRGARRRLEIKWASSDLVVIDDYAHHPTEVKASIRALCSMGKRLTVVFQPHRFSRTQYFMREFTHAFDDADELILTDIYSAGESNPDNIDVRTISEEVSKSGRLPVVTLPKREIMDYLMHRPRQEGIVAFLGAGDIGEIANEFAGRFKSYATA